MKTKHMYLLLLLLFVTHPNHAQAQDKSYTTTTPEWTIDNTHDQHKNSDFSALLSLWPDNVGVALWFALPLASHGVLPDINDAMFLELGGYIATYRNSNYWNDGNNDFAITPSIGARWQFYVSHLYAPYLGLKIGSNIGFGDYNPNFFEVDLTFGSFININKSTLLRLELGYPQGLGAGLTFLL